MNNLLYAKETRHCIINCEYPFLDHIGHFDGNAMMARNANQGEDANIGLDCAAFAAACDKLGFDPRFAPARIDDDRSEDVMADLAANLHAERTALLAAEDHLTAEEYEALRPLLATFRSNSIPQRDIRSVVEQLLDGA